MASPSTLQLDRFVVHKLLVESRASQAASEVPQVDDRKVRYACKIEFKSGKQANVNRFLGRLRLTFTWPEDPSSAFSKVHIDIEGFFRLPDDMPEDKVSKFVPRLLGVNLIGLARGVVLHATAFCPEGPFAIPIMDVSSDFEPKKAQGSLSRKPGGGDAATKRSQH